MSHDDSCWNIGKYIFCFVSTEFKKLLLNNGRPFNLTFNFLSSESVPTDSNVIKGFAHSVTSHVIVISQYRKKKIAAVLMTWLS